MKRSELPKLSFDLIFNATPVGMGRGQETPLEENELNTTWVFDSVYNPIETRLLKLAQSKGCGTISGAEMFVHQAARQFEIWTGKPAPMDAMRQVLLRQLGAAGTEGSIAIPPVVAPKSKVQAASNISADTEAEAAESDEGSAAKPVAAAAAKTAEKVPAKAASKKDAPVKTAPAKAAAGKAVPAKGVKAAVKVAAKPTGKAAAETCGEEAVSQDRAFSA